jgi:hypothetical protein
MELAEIESRVAPVLKKYRVARAAIFGSYARGEATENSDIDILIEFEGDRSLLDLAGLKIELEEALGKKVDVLTYKSLDPLLRDRILSEQKLIQ